MLSSTSNLLSRCTYMNSRQFNNLFSHSSNSNCFSLFHLNIRSFKKHSVDLEEYLSTLNTSFSAIGLSETWLDTTSNDLHSIPGYHFISKPRPVRSGSGVGIFLCDTYEYKKRCDLESMNCVLESVFVEIVQQIMRKMSSWAVYTNPLTFRLKSLMMKLNKSLQKLALRINYVFFLVTLTSIFLTLTHMSLLMISLISCIPMVSILLSLNQQGSRLIQLLWSITSSPMTLTITNLVVSFGLTFLITYLYFRSLIVPLNLKLNLQFIINVL